MATKPQTNKAEYDQLLAEKRAADKAFFAYRKVYNAEHKVPKGLITDTIIRLHKKGLSPAQILEQNPHFSKGTIRRQIRLFTKGKRVEKTTVSKYIPKKTK